MCFFVYVCNRLLAQTQTKAIRKNPTTIRHHRRQISHRADHRVQLTTIIITATANRITIQIITPII